jgi:serine/threonine-protein kinase
VGIYVDAKPGVAARAIDVISPTRNWQGAIYAAPNGPPPTTLDGFTKLASIAQSKTRTRVKLNPDGKRYRYYLVWITKLPPNESSVQIAEIRLFRLSSS